MARRHDGSPKRRPACTRPPATHSTNPTGWLLKGECPPGRGNGARQEICDRDVVDKGRTMLICRENLVHDLRPVTPEVAGSSPVAPVPQNPCTRGASVVLWSICSEIRAERSSAVE